MLKASVNVLGEFSHYDNIDEFMAARDPRKAFDRPGVDKDAKFPHDSIVERRVCGEGAIFL